MLEHAEPIVSGLKQIADSFIELLPALLSAALLLVIGWLVARTVRAITLRSAKTLNRGAQALGLGGLVRTIGSEGSTTKVLASVFYWLVILFFLTSATNVLGLTVFTGWLEQLVTYLPQILSGALIIFAGIILANIARDALIAALPGVPEQQRNLLGRLVQGLTVVVLVVVGLDQIGIDITIIITILSVAVAALLGGLSLAFSLGARTFVSNVIGSHYLDRDFSIGQKIRFAETEGAIAEITATTVILETSDGRLIIPAHRFAEETTLIRTGD
jgi:small-conductance mechanosensitive channel